MTLIQTGKMARRPIVLVGSDYWGGLYHWLKGKMRAGGYISAGDLDFLELVDSGEQAAGILLGYYRRECLA